MKFNPEMYDFLTTTNFDDVVSTLSDMTDKNLHSEATVLGIEFLVSQGGASLEPTLYRARNILARHLQRGYLDTDDSANHYKLYQFMMKEASYILDKEQYHHFHQSF